YTYYYISHWGSHIPVYHYDSSGEADWLRLQNDFHQVRFVPVQPLEPGGTFFQRRHGADQWVHLNRACRHQFDTGRVFPVGSARALDADLARDHELQGKIHIRRDIAYQRYGA